MTFRFGAFELTPDRGELRRNGVRIRLQHQPLLVLAVLVARAGDVVSREELRRAVWPDGTYVDFDRGLNFCINRIRRTLDEDARAPRYIETVPRAGYRFIAEVTRVASDSAATAATSDVGEGVGPVRPLARGWSRARHAALAAMTMAVMAVAQGAGSGRVTRPAPEPVPAAYSRGLYEARDANGGEKSLRSFEEAARLAPGNAAVAAALARSWVRAVEEGRVTPRDGMPRARAAAERSVALGDVAGAHLVLGTVALRHDWDWDAAERSLRRAIELDPSSAPALLEMADLMLVRGRPAAAVEAAERAESLDPVCPVVRGQVAGSYYAARRFADAASAWRRSSLVAPGLVGLHERLFHAYRHSALPREATGEAVTVLALLGVPGGQALARRLPQEAMALFLTGTISHLEKDAGRAPALVADRIAVLHAALGHKEDALRWLAVAVRERSITLPVTLATDPDLDTVRSEPSFRALLDQLALS